jgi:hypothetical protein
VLNGTQQAIPQTDNQRQTKRYLVISLAKAGRSSNGYLLFDREGTVLAQPFNPDKLELAGDPVPVAERASSFSR